MTETPSPPSKGQALSIVMLLFMVLELSLFIDARMAGGGFNNPYVFYYFAAKGVLAVVQLAGILLVRRERFRLGGALQIFASALHVHELMGIVGVMGGLAAYRYPDRLQGQMVPARP